MHAQASNEHEDFPEDALLEEEAAGWSAQFVIPFQQSGPLPTANQETARASTNTPGIPGQRKRTLEQFPMLQVILISAFIGFAAVPRSISLRTLPQ